MGVMFIGAGGRGRFMRIPRLVAVAAGITAVVAAAASGPGWNSGAAGAVRGAGLADVAVRPGVQHVGRAQLSPPTTASCRKDYKVACYQPAQIQQAYHLPALYARGITGRGTTIVIVDSFGSPTIKSDLAAFDQAFGLDRKSVV